MDSKWGRVIGRVVLSCGALYTAYTVIQRRYETEAKVYDGMQELIGNTPMVKLKSLCDKDRNINVYAKLEMNNPGGSAKDRIALNIIQVAEAEGRLVRGEPGMVFEGTSGSTGISLAMICNALGYKAHISLPDDTSLEKLNLLKSLGAIINPVKPASIVDPDQYVNAAKKACDDYLESGKTKYAIFSDQFENEHNWEIHYRTTGPEIYKQLKGKVNCFISGCGTGGTISGVSKYLKERIRPYVVLADPQGSGFYNRINYGVMYDSVEKEGTRRRHQVDTIVEGIGLNRLTFNFLKGEKYIDESIRVTDPQAIKMAKFLSINEGLFIGSSTAINAVAALELIRRNDQAILPNDSNIVIIACDSGSRHLSKFWKEALQVPDTVTLNEILASK
ncbi:Cysteine synthase/cystathionine beta-synthase P-phosphate attachment site [Nakaseomyces glabratus]|nr:Cysteine synthase/cystathionine beta-synthase P-phosphate attachment site [Nakaseomyces glabratus]